MAIPRTLEGTWDELAAHADELRAYGKLLLIIPETELRAAGALLENEAVRIAAIDAVKGKYAHLGVTVEDYLREKRADKEKEERRAQGLKA